MLIKVVIIDDEPLARKGLKEYVADVDFLQLVGEFDHPLKAADLISKGEVQLLLLDIQMPKLNGFVPPSHFASHLLKSIPLF